MFQRSRPARPPFFTGITFYFAELPKVSLTLDGTLMGLRVTWPDLLGGGGCHGEGTMVSRKAATSEREGETTLRLRHVDFRPDPNAT